LRAAATSQPQPELNIRADKATQYKVIWKVMQEAKSAGMVHLGFITAGKARPGASP
jgi:biopolymer transport protein ExbD